MEKESSGPRIQGITKEIPEKEKEILFSHWLHIKPHLDELPISHISIWKCSNFVKSFQVFWPLSLKSFPSLPRCTCQGVFSKKDLEGRKSHSAFQESSIMSWEDKKSESLIQGRPWF